MERRTRGSKRAGSPQSILAGSVRKMRTRSRGRSKAKAMEAGDSGLGDKDTNSRTQGQVQDRNDNQMIRENTSGSAVDITSLASALSQALGPVIADTLKTLGVTVAATAAQTVGESPPAGAILSSPGEMNGGQAGEQLGQPQLPNPQLPNVSAVVGKNNNVSPITVPGSQAFSTGVMTENQNSSSCRMDGPVFVPSKLPLHAMVPLKKREQIWRGEFVELSTLQEEEPEEFMFNIRTGKVSSNASKKKFLNIEQWTDAFLVFSSVYRIKFPQEAEALASYMSLIRRIANEGGGWYNYDRQFRRLKANSIVGQYKWDQREDELFFLALNHVNRRQLFRSENRGNNNVKSDKAKHLSCFKYDKGRNCSGCRYPHVCRECGGKHPVFKCWSKVGKTSENKSRGEGVFSPVNSEGSGLQRQRGQNQSGGSQVRPKPGN